MKTLYTALFVTFLLTYLTGQAQNTDTLSASPNPFSTSTELTIANLSDDTVTLRIYNRWGDIVASFFKNQVLTGTLTVTFNADSLTNDTYFAVLFLNSDIHHELLTKSGTTTILKEPQNSLTRVRVYPNPTSDWLYISNDLNMTGFELYDITGRQLLQANNGLEKTLDLQNLEAGIYLLNIKSNDMTYIQKIIKK